jgi:hypothetical protein
LCEKYSRKKNKYSRSRTGTKVTGYGSLNCIEVDIRKDVPEKGIRCFCEDTEEKAGDSIVAGL